MRSNCRRTFFGNLPHYYTELPQLPDQLSYQMFYKYVYCNFQTDYFLNFFLNRYQLILQGDNNVSIITIYTVFIVYFISFSLPLKFKNSFEKFSLSFI